MRGFFVVFCVAAFILPAEFHPLGADSASQATEKFSLANQHYAEGNYQEAMMLYEAMIQAGISSGPLDYNLGNVYFKLGRLGKSLLNYERARRLMGQDEDLLANLSFVTTLLEQEQPKEKYRWHEWIVVFVRDLFSAKTWAVTLFAFYTLFFGTLILAIFVERFRKRALSFAWLFGCLAIFCLVFASTKWIAEESGKTGVIVQRSVDVRYSPSPSGAVAFQLREGIRAQVNRCENGWCHIRLTRDKSGWVESSAIEAI